MFDLFDLLKQGRINVCSIVFLKRELEALLCEIGETKCEPFFLKDLSHFRGRFNRLSLNNIIPKEKKTFHVATDFEKQN